MEEFEEYHSKSAEKREQLLLQEFAVKLAELSANKLAQLPIPDELLKALEEYKRMKSHGAIHRQAQFLGKVMRKIDHETLIKAYKNLKSNQATQQHMAEEWRIKLMSEDKKTLTEFINEFPMVDRQTLRQHIKNAIDERDHHKYPGAQKALFRFLYTLIGQV